MKLQYSLTGPKKKMEPMVFLHGAWYGSWCWEPLKACLAPFFSHLFCPHLPYFSLSHPPLSLKRIAEEVATQIPSHSTVVAHSLSGALLLLLAHHFPQKIARMIFLTAYLPLPGESVLQLTQKEPEEPLSSAFSSHSTKQALILDPETAPSFLFHHGSPEKQKEAATKWVAHPLKTLAKRVHYDLSGVKNIPGNYLVCEDDRAITPQLQKVMAQRMGLKTTSLFSCHSPFLSCPEKLAWALMQARSQLGEDERR